MGRLWINFEAWARDRVGITVADVVAQYQKEGLLLSDTPNAQNCWEIRDYATWDGDVPSLSPEAIERRVRMKEAFLATWDGSIGAVVYPDGRELRIQSFEDDSMVRLMEEDLLPDEAASTHLDDLFSAGCHARMTLGFAMKPFPSRSNRHGKD